MDNRFSATPSPLLWRAPRILDVASESFHLRIGNGVGKQGYGNRPPIDDRNLIRKFSIDCLDASKTNELTQPQVTRYCGESRRKADTEFQYRPSIVDADPVFADPVFADPVSETPMNPEIKAKVVVVALLNQQCKNLMYSKKGVVYKLHAGWFVNRTPGKFINWGYELFFPLGGPRKASERNSPKKGEKLLNSPPRSDPRNGEKLQKNCKNCIFRVVFPLFWGNLPHFEGVGPGEKFSNFSPFFGDFRPGGFPSPLRGKATRKTGVFLLNLKVFPVRILQKERKV